MFVELFITSAAWFPFASTKKTRAASSKAVFLASAQNNRPFSSSPQPPFKSEAKCKVFVMKIIFYSY